MSIFNLKMNVPYEKAGLCADGCCPTLKGFTVDVSPEIGRRNRPAVVICPGGGYVFVSDREADYIAMRFAAFGIHAFVLRYSICGKPFPTALLEAASAVKAVRERADELDINKDNISICGFSAGGHLAASLAVHYRRDFLTSIMGDPDTYKPNKAILSYPVISSGKYTHAESMESIIGKNPSDELRELVSCEKQVSADTPPVFIWHCADDGCVPVQNSLKFIDALAEVGVSFEAHIYPDGGHGGSLHDDVTSAYEGHINPVNAQWFGEAVRFIKTN